MDKKELYEYMKNRSRATIAEVQTELLLPYKTVRELFSELERSDLLHVEEDLYFACTDKTRRASDSNIDVGLVRSELSSKASCYSHAVDLLYNEKKTTKYALTSKIKGVSFIASQMIIAWLVKMNLARQNGTLEVVSLMTDEDYAEIKRKDPEKTDDLFEEDDLFREEEFSGEEVEKDEDDDEDDEDESVYKEETFDMVCEDDETGKKVDDIISLNSSRDDLKCFSFIKEVALAVIAGESVTEDEHAKALLEGKTCSEEFAAKAVVDLMRNRSCGSDETELIFDLIQKSISASCENKEDERFFYGLIYYIVIRLSPPLCEKFTRVLMLVV